CVARAAGSPLVPYTTLFRSALAGGASLVVGRAAPELWRTREGAWNRKVVDGTRVGSADDHEHSVAERAFSILQAAMAYSPPLHRSEEHTSELQSPDHLVCRL